MSQDIPPALAPAWCSLDGFARHGPAYWPCARFFTLVSLDADGDTDGGSAEVCRACVIKVAVDAMYVLDNGTFGYEQVTKFNRQDGRDTTAVETCGPAPAYDL